jgi:SAM-dependent methyltransferase
MISEYRIDDFVYMNWLRPEVVILHAVAAKLIGEELLKSNNILEIGIGNGYFSFMILEGRFKKSYDWYYNVDTEGFWENKDIYDSINLLNIQNFIEKPPHKRLKLAIDHKENLLSQTKQLNFVDNLLCMDANEPMRFTNIETVYSNILYWLKNPIEVLQNIEINLKSNGKVILVFPNSHFFEYCRSYSDDESRLWKLINRGRTDHMMWFMDFDDFGKNIERHTSFEIETTQRYLSKLSLNTWDIGLRPLSPHLIKMANSLPDNKRMEIKEEWCKTCKKFIYELLENEIEKGRKEGGFNFVVLRKK